MDLLVQLDQVNLEVLQIQAAQMAPHYQGRLEALYLLYLLVSLADQLDLVDQIVQDYHWLR